MGPNKTRFKILKWGITFLFFVLISRLFYLQIIKHDFFKGKSKEQINRIVNLYPHRGNIYDTNNEPLALTQISYSAYAIPPEIKNKRVFAKTISKLLNLNYKYVYTKITAKTPFSWLKRKLDRQTYLALKQLKLKGLNFIKEEKRVYPNNMLSAHILGFVGIDNQGLGGLEHKYDKLLRGSPGKLFLEGDPRGRLLISGQKKVIPPYDGGHLVTTIDKYIQYSVQKHLKNGALKNLADGGQVIVMNPKNGDILAMADYPEFNPNKYYNYAMQDTKNSCITDVFEPGSVYKIITLAAALEEEIVTPGSIIEVPEELFFAGRIIKEAHDRKEGESDKKTVTEIIRDSLNVGTSLLSIKLGPEKIYKYSSFFGFGSPTNICLPGESSGLLRPLKTWSKVDVAMISFGQGIAVTPLQMACAVSAIANNGILLQPRLVKSISHSNGKTVKGITKKRRDNILSKKTADQVVNIMQQVVENGTATTVRIPGYNIAGKTGTAQKARKDGRGYEKGKYIASFIGFFPAEDPKILILVSIDNPKKSYWGSTVAGPIFKNIANDIIKYYEIPPNN
jgi:cell division protein FtsI/penicillin-binding protein 2